MMTKRTVVEYCVGLAIMGLIMPADSAIVNSDTFEKLKEIPIKISYTLVMTTLYPSSDIISRNGDKIQVVNHSVVSNGKETTFWTNKGKEIESSFIEGVSKTPYEVIQDRNWLMVTAFDTTGDRIGETVFDGRNTTVATYAKNNPEPYVEYLPNQKLNLEFYSPEYYTKRYKKIASELEVTLEKENGIYFDSRTSPTFSAELSSDNSQLFKMAELGTNEAASSIEFDNFVTFLDVDLPQKIIRDKRNQGGLTTMKSEFIDIKYENLDDESIERKKQEFRSMISSSQAAKGFFKMDGHLASPTSDSQDTTTLQLK